MQRRKMQQCEDGEVSFKEMITSVRNTVKEAKARKLQATQK